MLGPTLSDRVTHSSVTQVVPRWASQEVQCHLSFKANIFWRIQATHQYIRDSESQAVKMKESMLLSQVW